MEQAERAAWLQQRRSGIGGSDAAAILGVSPYATAYEVWLDKRGERAPSGPSEVMWWGTEMESLIARRYSEVTGRQLWDPQMLMTHPDYPMIVGTPDRLVLNEDRGVEIKTVGVRSMDQWGEPGTDEVPQHYAIQCHHYMLITGRKVWDLVPLMGGNEMRIYTIRRDEELAGWMLDTFIQWWQKHVVDGEAPTVTGAESTKNALARRFPKDVGVMLDPTPETEELMRSLAIYRSRSAEADAAKQEYENQLKALMGEASGINGTQFSVTWRAAKDTEKVDWKRVALDAIELLERKDHDTKLTGAELIERATSLMPGSRRFLFTPAKERR